MPIAAINRIRCDVVVSAEGRLRAVFDNTPLSIVAMIVTSEEFDNWDNSTADRLLHWPMSELW